MSPSSPRCSNTGLGKRCSRSHAPACGATSSSAKRRAKSRTSRCSSVSSCTLIARAPLGGGPAPRSSNGALSSLAYRHGPCSGADERREGEGGRGLQAPAQLLEAHDLPALLARDAAQLGVWVDHDGV